MLLLRENNGTKCALNEAAIRNVAKWQGKSLQNSHHGFKSHRRLFFMPFFNIIPLIKITQSINPSITICSSRMRLEITGKLAYKISELAFCQFF